MSTKPYSFFVHTFTDYLLTRWSLSESALETLRSFFREEHIPSESNFVREGNISAKIGFVVSGHLKTFYRREDEEVIQYFSQPLQWIGHFESFEYQKNTPDSVYAITEVSLVTITASSFQKLITALPFWKEIWETIKTETYKERIHRFNHISNDQERYLAFIESQTDLALHLSPEEISQYLNIPHQQLINNLCEMIFIPKTPK